MFINAKNKKTVFILSVSSGIGLELAKQYLAAGYFVIGTYRQKKHIEELLERDHCVLFHCDITRQPELSQLVNRIKQLRLHWDIFISCVGMLQPLAKFFQVDFEKWDQAIHVNAIEQLRVLHAIYPLRRKKGVCHAVFFAGSGTNNVVVNMSSYITSKIMLIKMCEFLNAENKDLNVFIVGPGWTRTKAHDQVLADKNTPREKYLETLNFLKTSKGTEFKKIFDCIQWLCRCGKKAAGGRNFSIVHDQWEGPLRQCLIKELLSDPEMYKLRRHKNDFLKRTR